MPHRSLRPLRVLMVEDCEDDCDLFALRLRQAGFNPIAARVETMEELGEALVREEWQIIFSDFDLPGFDGLCALQLVRKADLDTPFFLISGTIDEEQAVAALKGGAQDYFFKGKLERLGAAVTRELEEADNRRKRKAQQIALDHDRNILTNDRIRFVDVMSHELRTPLNIINMAAGMLARYGERMDSEARCERTTEIQDAVARMTRIIDKVLLTSRLELRRWELRSDTFDLAEWCEEFLQHNTADAAQRKRVDLRVCNLPDKVTMDDRVLEIALQNLLSNALKYSPSASRVEMEVRRQPDNRIAFTIRDRGIGIPAADLSRVFSSFYRGSNVADVQGTGLGLAIVKECTELLGGTIGVESEQGCGTTATICLPDWLQSSVDKEEVLGQTEVMPA